jgi:hypothetical protein
MTKFNKEDMKMIEWCEEPNEYFKIIDEGEWTQDHKYQYRDIIFKFGEKFYCLGSSRSGSPFTDWYYSSEDWNDTVECCEVEKVEVVKYIWKAVK